MAGKEADKLSHLLALIEGTDGWTCTVEKGTKRAYIQITSPGIDSMKMPYPNSPTTATNLQLRQRAQQIGFDWAAAEERFKEQQRLTKEKEAEEQRAAERRLAEGIKAKQRAARAEQERLDAEERARKPRRTEKAKRYTVTMTITPEWCLPYITERNGPKGRGNRPTDPALVKRYAKDMRDGKFIDCPEPIIIDWDDHVNNGQHRMLASIESGVSFTCDVTFDADPALFDRMDSGKRRTGADVLGATLNLGARGLSAQMQAALRMLYNYDNEPVTAWGQTKILNHEIMALYADYPGIEDALTTGRRLTGSNLRDRPCMAPASAQVFVYLARRAWPMGEKTLNAFLEGVTTGHGLTSGDPRDALLNYLMVASKRNPGQRKIANVPEQLMVALKCWAAFCKGEKMKRKDAAWDTTENTIQAYRPHIG